VLADRRGVSVSELLGTGKGYSWREYIAWQYFISESAKEDDKYTHYLMQLTAQVAKVLSNSPEKILPEHYKLKWGDEKKKPKTEAEKNDEIKKSVELAKAAWAQRLAGYKVSKNE